MTEAIVIQVTFNLEMKLEQFVFLQNKDILEPIMRPFAIPVRMGMCIRMSQPKNSKEGMLSKTREKKTKKMAYKSPSCWKLNFKSAFFSKL